MVGKRHIGNNHHQGDDSSSLLQDIRRMLHNEAFHDVVFVCGDQQEEIGACRVLVASRSPMLESMLLSSGLSENQQTRIPLPNIDLCTMRICVEFLYTDTVQDSSWHSILSAMKVVEAAMFFLLIRLERLAITYMHRTSFRNQSEDDEWILGIVAAYNLGLQLHPVHLSKKDKGLMNMDNLLDKFRVYVQNRAGCDATKLFARSNHERLIYRNLTETAFAHVIQNKYSLEQPLVEYFTFLHLVRWTTSRLVQSDTVDVDEDEVEEILNRWIPRSLDILSSSILVDVDDNQTRKVMKLLSGWLLQTVQRFPLSFAKIPTDILCRFIEPLCIIPEATLLSAYRLQALSMTDLRWDPFGHGKKYSIDNGDSSVISCSRDTFKNFARCSTYLSTTKDTFFEWEIAILTRCEKMRIGFYIHRLELSNSVHRNKSSVLGDESGSWALGSDGRLYSANFGSGPPKSLLYSDPFDEKDEVVVQVHLDMANSSCSFTINGEEAGVAWRNIPFGKHWVYPAISLSKHGKVQVRRITHSWMESPHKRLRKSSLEDF